MCKKEKDFTKVVVLPKYLLFSCLSTVNSVLIWAFAVSMSPKTLFVYGASIFSHF